MIYDEWFIMYGVEFLRLCLVIIALISLSGQSIAFALVSDHIAEQNNLHNHENSMEHTSEKHEHTGHHLADTVDECCDVDCCEGECVCPQNSCASGLFLDISTSFPTLQVSRTFALTASHNLAEIHLPSWHRPPINWLI